jgi:archaellum component FlaC
MKISSLEEDIEIMKEILKRLYDAKREHSSRIEHMKTDIRTHYNQYETLSNEINVCRLLQDKFKEQSDYDDNSVAIIKCELEQIMHIQDKFSKDLEIIRRDLKDDILRFNQKLSILSIGNNCSEN